MSEPVRTNDRVIRVELVKEPKTLLRRATELTPLFISIIALATSIWSATASRQHSRLSVRPEVTFKRETSLTADVHGLFLINSGIGPAAVSDIRLYFDGEQVEGWDKVTAKTGFVGTYRRDNTPNANWFKYGLMVRAGDTVPLYFIDGGLIFNRFVFQTTISERIFMIAKFCSMYDECSYACTEGPNDKCLEAEKSLKKAVPSPAAPKQ